MSEVTIFHECACASVVLVGLIVSSEPYSDMIRFLMFEMQPVQSLVAVLSFAMEYVSARTLAF
jgi:hypothetical protein